MTANLNPFIISGYIPPQYFCDRQQEARNLHLAITNQQNVVLSAARRMGKTKLIDYVFERKEIQENYITISIDILQTSSLSEFIFVLGNAIFNKVAKRSERLMKLFPMMIKSLTASFGYDPISATPTFEVKLGDITRPEYTLEEIFSYLDEADKRCLIVIDEFQQITYYAEKNVEALLRTYIQKAKNATFVFSGSQRRVMSEMFGSAQRPFYNSARSLELEAIPLDVYTDFVIKHFKAAEKDILPEAVKKGYETLQGVTLYNQQIMNTAYAITPVGETCDVSTIEKLIEDLIQQNDRKMRELLQFVGEMQKAVLFAIFEEQPVKSISSAAFTKKHRLKSPSSTQAAVKKLLELDFITREEGYYRIADPLMFCWMERNLR